MDLLSLFDIGYAIGNTHTDTPDMMSTIMSICSSKTYGPKECHTLRADTSNWHCFKSDDECDIIDWAVIKCNEIVNAYV